MNIEILIALIVALAWVLGSLVAIFAVTETIGYFQNKKYRTERQIFLADMKARKEALNA